VNTQTRAGAAPAATLAATLGLAAVAWAVTVRQMTGMDMGPESSLGSVAFFAALWVPMMAAMMLPGAAPAAVRVAQDSGGIRAVPLFLGSYLAVWALVGVAVYALYRPHGTLVAGLARSRRELTSSPRSRRTSGGAARPAPSRAGGSGSAASARPPG
jgi:predicted metal-binding membrane protein